MTRFDHLVVGVRRLDEAIEAFERLSGVRPVRGGRHPERGTENALVSLGDAAYLEILAPRDDAPLAPADESLRQLDRFTLIDWALAVDDADVAASAIRAAGLTCEPPRAGSRETPSGARLAWRTIRVAGVPCAPFFIEWDRATRHPARDAPAGCGLEMLKICSPSALLARLPGLAHPDLLQIRNGSPALLAELTAPGGRRFDIAGRE